MADTANGPVSPLNAVWCGRLHQKTVLPQLGHAFLIFPLDGASVRCGGRLVDGRHYLWLTRPPASAPPAIEGFPQGEPNLLLLLFSPGFLADMAGFLGIPDEMDALLHGVPLLRGDAISRLLQGLSGGCGSYLADPRQAQVVEELYLEVVGQALQLMRLRHAAMLSLADLKPGTAAGLLPALLRARQFIEAHCLHPLKTQDVARVAGFSEYHFARLFKAAFDATVHQYLRRMRLAEACRMLETSGKSVTEIALSVGYTSLSAFIHAFRRSYGLSPSGYRAQFA